MADKDYYAVLGVPRGATLQQIKDAYRELALRFHPDRNKDAGAEERFKRISEAYAVLSDGEKRRQYDEWGSEGFGRRFTQEDIFRGADFGDFEDLFRQMGFGFETAGPSPFSGMFGGLFSQFRRGRGQDLLAETELSLEEASKGVEKEIPLKRLADCARCNGTGSEDGRLAVCPSCGGTGQKRSARRVGYSQFINISTCPACGGSGRVASKTCKSCNGSGKEKTSERLAVRIPAGVDDGFRLRLQGKGNASEEPGEPAGDLYVAVRVRRHPLFRREGADIIHESKIPFALAALGGETQVPTLSGTAALRIPAGTQPGTVFRLKGRGVYDLRERRHGDELVRVVIDVPAKLSGRQKELLEEFDKESGGSRKGKGFFKKIFR